MTRIAAAVMVALLCAACPRREVPRPPASSDPDEHLVAAFEEMARISELYGADCERWAKEQMRALGTERIRGFNEILLSKSEQERSAFHAKYARRIDPLQAKVSETSARCTEELSRAALRPIKVWNRPQPADGGEGAD